MPMSVRLSCATIALASGVLLTSPGLATAQLFLPFPNPFNNCCARPMPQPCCQPVAQACCQPVPVTQTCYRTVPVTEYRQVRKTVKRPVIETKYVEQPVTEYRQVVEPKTVDVRSVQYQDVTECQTRQCNTGYWATRYKCVPRVTPCEYDNRPDLLGFLNRTGYSLRMALTPTTIASREYVPQTATQTIPVTRRVAIPTTRKVTYNVTRLVPYTSTRKVAVNTVRYVDEEVVALQPVTVMKTVAVGTQVAYSYAPYITGGTQTALRPSPDPISSSDADKTSPKRTAEARGKFDSEDVFEPVEPKQPDPTPHKRVPAKKSSLSDPVPHSSAKPAHFDQQRVELNSSPTSRPLPSVVRVSGWRARRSPTVDAMPATIALTENTP